MVRLTGKSAHQIMNLVSNYVYLDKDNGQECTLRHDRVNGTLQVQYADGHVQVYNDIAAPSNFIALRLKPREKESRLATSASS